MRSYSIKDLEKITGIKAHTIRIWEKRYHVVSPQRTNTNIRYYTDDDLKHLLNIAILNRYGYKISGIVNMNSDEINKLIIDITVHETDYDSLIESFFIAMVEYDEMRFEKALNNAIIKLGFESAIINVIYPFLSRVGVLWQTGTVIPGQEHFVTNLIRQKFILAVDSIHAGVRNHPKLFIIFLPENEYHELGLLFTHYLIKKSGHNAIYLGANVPLPDVEQLASLKRPDFLFTIIATSLPVEELNTFVSIISGFLPKGKVLLASVPSITEQIEVVPDNVILMKSIPQFTTFLESLAS
ncbi:MAG TPA: MerR family transcriptional regulator [Bacteroidales bacterium]|nr:MerR family transcriptional regulator [Bacteroidales bacterium]